MPTLKFINIRNCKQQVTSSVMLMNNHQAISRWVSPLLMQMSVSNLIWWDRPRDITDIRCQRQRLMGHLSCLATVTSHRRGRAQGYYLLTSPIPSPKSKPSQVPGRIKKVNLDSGLSPKSYGQVLKWSVNKSPKSKFANLDHNFIR